MTNKKNSKFGRGNLMCYTAIFALSLYNNASNANVAEYPNSSPEFDCNEVSVDELYINYRHHSDTVVCTSGAIEATVGGVYLLPNDPDLTLSRQKLIRLQIRYADFLRKGFNDGDILYMVGKFTYQKNCFEGHDIEGDKTKKVCAPQQFPMYINDITIYRD